MKQETLILTDDDFYNSPTGRTLRGGSKMLFESSLVIKLNRDHSFSNPSIEIIKNRNGLSKKEIIAQQLGSDKRLLLIIEYEKI